MAGRPKRRAKMAAVRKKNPGMPGSLRGAGALYVNPRRALDADIVDIRGQRVTAEVYDRSTGHPGAYLGTLTYDRTRRTAAGKLGRDPAAVDAVRAAIQDVRHWPRDNPGRAEHARRAAHQQSLFDRAPAGSRSRVYHQGARDAHRGVPRANPGMIEAKYPGPAYYDSIQGPIAVRILSRSGDTFRVRSEGGHAAWPKGYEWDVKVRDTFPRKALGGKYGTRIKPYRWIE